MKNFFRFLSIVAVMAVVILASAFFLLPLPGSMPVLMYHFLAGEQEARDSKNFVTVESFERQMDFLRRFGYRVITMDDYYAARTGKRKPRGREVVITFDDGNESFETKAFPVLQKHRFPVTLFLVSESLQSATHGSMSVEIVKRLAQEPWIHIGAHTQTHPILLDMDDAGITGEIAGSRKDLEEIFGVPVLDLAYPAGRFDERAVNAARAAGFRLAFTTSPKKLGDLDLENKYPLHAVTRVKISRTSDNLFAFWVKLTGLYELFKQARQNRAE